MFEGNNYKLCDNIWSVFFDDYWESVVILNLLEKLGLSGKKGRFYLAALELGEAPVHNVAKRAGIGRTTAYDILSSLIKQGLLSQIEKSGRTCVVAEDPAILIANLEERRRVLDAALPEIRAVYNRSSVKPRIHYYEGEEGIVSVLNETLNCRSGELYGILSMVELLNTLGEDFMRQYIQRRTEAGLNLCVVRSREEEVSDTWKTKDEELRKVRFAPKDTRFTMTSYIYDDTVSLVSSSKESFAVRIESAEFARLQKTLFETLWAASEEA